MGLKTLSISKNIKTIDACLSKIYSDLDNRGRHYKIIKLSPGNTEFELLEDGKCLVHKKTRTLCFELNKGKYVIPDSVTSIGYAGLRYSNYYSPIIFPERITKLPKNTFKEARVGHVYIEGALRNSMGSFAKIKQVKMIVAGRTNPRIFTSYGARVAALKGYPKAYYEGKYDEGLLPTWNKFIVNTFEEAIKRHNYFPLHENVIKYLTTSGYFNKEFIAKLEKYGFLKQVDLEKITRQYIRYLQNLERKRREAQAKAYYEARARSFELDRIEREKNRAKIGFNFNIQPNPKRNQQIIDSLTFCASNIVFKMKSEGRNFSSLNSIDIKDMLMNHEKHTTGIVGLKKDVTPNRFSVSGKSNNQINAVYSGTDKYIVSLYADGTTIRGKCSCPAYERTYPNPCKHICGFYEFLTEIKDLDSLKMVLSLDKLMENGSIDNLDINKYNIMDNRWHLNDFSFGSDLEILLVSDHFVWALNKNNKIIILDRDYVINYCEVNEF